MKHTSLLCLALALSFTAVGEADESNGFDREDRRPAQGETQRHGAQLPPPLRIFDKNRDNALSPEEIQDLAERLQQLDRDGDGKIGPRELEGFFAPPRPRRRGDDRFDRGPDERGRRGPPGRGDDRFEDDGFNDRFNRRPPSIQRSGPDGRPPRATNGGDSGVQWLVDRLYQFDANDDGKLSKDELPNRAKRLVEQADRDQDGMIDRAELEQFLLNR